MRLRPSRPGQQVRWRGNGRGEHGGGFSVDASVRIEGADRTGLERLLRYCARPPFSLEHRQQLDAEHLVYHCPKPRPDGPNDLALTPLELIDKIAALAPPRRIALSVGYAAGMYLMKLSRWPVRFVTPRCGSSPLSTMPAPCGRFWIASASQTLPPRIPPARGPPLWESVADFRQVGNDPQWDTSAQIEPEFEFDQHVAW